MTVELVFPALDLEDVTSEIVANLNAAGDRLLCRELRGRVFSLLEKISELDVTARRRRHIERAEQLVARCWAILDICKIDHPKDQPLHDRSMELLRRIRSQLAVLDRTDHSIH